MYLDKRNQKYKEQNSLKRKCQQCKQRCSTGEFAWVDTQRVTEEKYRLCQIVNLSKYVDYMWNMTKWNAPFFSLLADLYMQASMHSEWD